MNIFAPFIKWKAQKEYAKLHKNSLLTYEAWKKDQVYLNRDNIEQEYHYPAVIYGDYEIERTSASTRVVEPVFLPDFSPNRWDYEDYLGPAVYVREDFVEKIDINTTNRREFIQSLIEQGERVCHVPQILSKIQANKIYKKANTDQLSGYICIGDWEYEDYLINHEHVELSLGEYTISIIIPSKNNIEMLSKAVTSVIATSNQFETIRYKLEIIIVDNGSDKDTREQVASLCASVDEKEDKTIICTYLYKEMDFNFSSMCNIGAMHATGQILLFLNDDIEAVDAGWLESMIAEVFKPYTGAVGCKLLYPDGERIQHAGIVNLPMGPVHKLQFLEDKHTYYDARNRGIHNVSAVTGACLMIQKELFFKMGGMKLELPIAFNDVELCYHLLQYGYYNVVCCDVALIHHESVSRGHDTSIEKRNRLLQERKKLYDMYPSLQGKDSYYSYMLNHAFLDTQIKPAYLDGKSKIQVIQAPALKTALVEDDIRQKKAHIQLNPCLRLEIEQVYEELEQEVHIAGYAFVTGSDNALFEKYLLLESQQGYYKLLLKPQYRSDLEKQLSDQIHVALCHFHVKCYKDEFDHGTYRVGLIAKNKASSLMLIQWSNVLLEL
ncbi:MAG: glycosyltransferase [Lachnospiraceae bacterium]